MNILSKLSLRKQIWAGFISILLLIVLVSCIAFSRLFQVQNQVNHIAEDIQPAMLTALRIKENIQSSTSLMGLYIINKTPEYAEKFDLSLSQLKSSLTQFYSLPVVQNEPKMQENINKLEELISQFIQHQKRIDYLNKNFIDNFPGIKIANTEINPRHQETLQIFSEMIESESEEDVTEERRLHLQQINDLRQNWMTIVSLLRTFLANPSLARTDQLNIYIEQHEKLQSKLNLNSDLFTFEQEESVPRLNEISKEYFKFTEQIFDIYKKDQWREDVSLIKHEINPIINQIGLQVDSMIDYQKNAVKTANTILIENTQNTLILILIVLSSALFIGVITAKITCKQINTLVIEINQLLKNILNGDFSLRMNENRAGDIGRLAHTVNQFSEKLKEIIVEIQSSLTELHGTSNNLTSVTQETTNNILQQNTATEVVSAAVEQMSITSKDVARKTEDASKSAKHADINANNGSDISNDALKGMVKLINNLDNSAKVIQSLQTDTNNISMVLDVIRDISEQTNLLALNAAIEAARAGEQGRGFAVVADEVRTLASRTQDSTDQIKELIDRLQHGAKNAVDVMSSSIDEANSNSTQVKEVANSLSTIKEEIVNINSILEQVSVASEQQSSTSDEILNNIVSISNIAKSTSQCTESLHTAESELDHVTHRLDSVISIFNKR